MWNIQHITNLLESLCFCAVNIYAMITGFVLVNRKIKIKRIISLWLQVVFYLLMSGVLIKLFYPAQCGISTFIKAIIPIISSQYWYFTAYFIMFWFIPLYNWITNNLNFQEFRKLIITMLLIFVCLGWLSSLINGLVFGLNLGYSFLWISVIYFIGAGIKKYGLKLFFIEKNISQRLVLCIALFFGILPYLSKIILILLTNAILGRQIFVEAFYSYLSPTVVIESICWLIYFSRLKVNKQIITTISATTFGIYLIHLTPFFQQVAWNIINKYINVPLTTYIIVIIISIIIIFVLCSMIEFIRIKLFDVLRINQLVDYAINKSKLLIMKYNKNLTNE